MCSVSVRMAQEERELIEAYAKLQGISFSEAMRRAILEKIEDEYDIALGEQAYRKYIESGKKIYTPEEVNKELGFD